MAGCQIPTPNCLSYERGSQMFIFQGVTTTQTQSGTAAPANAKVYGIVPIVSRGQMPYNIAVQVDVSAGTFDGAASEIDILGSLDGVNFYVIDRDYRSDRLRRQRDEVELGIRRPGRNRCTDRSIHHSRDSEPWNGRANAVCEPFDVRGRESVLV